MNFKTFEIYIYLEIIYINIDIIMERKNFKGLFKNIQKNISPKVVP
jgi:hypothetical protein